MRRPSTAQTQFLLAGALWLLCLLTTFGVGLIPRLENQFLEFMADYLGATLAARAGYDPYGLLAVLQTLASINPEDDAVALMFKTHPPPEERMDRLTDFLDDKLGKYAEQSINAERFARIMQGYMKRQQPSG